MEVGLVALLRAAWLAGTIPILVAFLPFSPLRSFHSTLLGFAGRGKIRHSGSGSVSSNKFTVPQRFFLHFYVVAVAWTTFLLLLTWFYAYRTMAPLSSDHYSTIASNLIGGSHIFSLDKSHLAHKNHIYRVWRVVFLLLLMEAQVLRRLYETLHVFDYSPSARMHIFGYLTGLFFYTAAPLSLSCSCAPEVFKYATHQVVEFIVKGRAQMPVIEFDWWGFVKPFTILGWFQWSGAAIFLWGCIHQYRCHSILGLMREQTLQSEEYGIPHGDWFKIVSCPHYLAEIVIYAGLLVASGGSDITVWLLFGFVVSNLVFAAAETQRWYHCKFDNYPRSRYAILPFIY